MSGRSSPVLPWKSAAGEARRGPSVLVPYKEDTRCVTRRARDGLQVLARTGAGLSVSLSQQKPGWTARSYLQEGKERRTDPSARRETVAAGGETPRRGGETRGRVKELQARRGVGDSRVHLGGEEEGCLAWGAEWGPDPLKAELRGTKRKRLSFLEDPAESDLSRHPCDPGAGGPRPLLSHGVLNAWSGSWAGI